MPITTELLGRLGGKPETKTVTFKAPGGYMPHSIPDGWKKAAGEFVGTATADHSVKVFGREVETRLFEPATGNVVLNAGETSTIYRAEGTITWYRLE